MQFDISYLTEVGRELATSTQGGANKIVYTHAEASSHDYSALSVADLKSLTAIEDVQQTVDYSHVTIKDKTSVALRVDFPSMSVTKPYNLYTVAFYARPDNGDEVLYAVMPSSIPDYVPAYDGYSNINDSFNMITTVSDTDNVMITVSQAGSLNEDDLDAIFESKHIATIDDIKANIPATVIDGSKPADFKEAVTFEKGAVDGAGNAIATTKNVSDGDAETLTSAKEYADTQASDKVKTSDIDPSVMIKNTLTANDDVLALGPGTYYTWGVKPNNFPATLVSWSTVVVKAVGNQPIDGKNVTITDTHASQLVNTYSGNASIGKWSGWHIPNENSVVKDNGDDTVTINGKSYVPANAANVVDRNPDTGVVSEPVDFTKLTVNGGKSVATSDDLKSLEASAWHQIALPDQQASKNLSLLYQVDRVNKQLKINLSGTFGSVTSDWAAGIVIADFGNIINGITSVDAYVTLIKLATDDNNANFTAWDSGGSLFELVSPKLYFTGSKLLIKCSDGDIKNGYGRINTPGGEAFAMVNDTITYKELVQKG